MGLSLYLSGEIHTDWREQIIAGCAGMDVEFSAPVTDHAASDDCGVAILGEELDKFWHDHKGANGKSNSSGMTSPGCARTFHASYASMPMLLQAMCVHCFQWALWSSARQSGC